MINIDHTLLGFFVAVLLRDIFLNLWQDSEWIVGVDINMFFYSSQEFISLYKVVLVSLWGDDNFIDDSLFFLFIGMIGHIVEFDENFSLFSFHIRNKYFQDRSLGTLKWGFKYYLLFFCE